MLIFPPRQRLQAIHLVLKRFNHGSVYFGPLSQELRLSSERDRVVLDFGTGKGQWYVIVFRRPLALLIELYIQGDRHGP